MYITDHRDGGYGQKSDYEKERETIFAGVEHGQATGVGPLCEYTSIDGADKADQSDTFEVKILRNFTLENIFRASETLCKYCQCFQDCKTQFFPLNLECIFRLTNKRFTWLVNAKN